MFTARYGLSPYTKQIGFFLKGLTANFECSSSKYHNIRWISFVTVCKEEERYSPERGIIIPTRLLS